MEEVFSHYSKEIKGRFYGTVNTEIISRMLEIAADVLEPSASEW
ncbi:hypothetical protein JOC95_000348 [Bacillus tianshenii]|uniref:Transposase n=1 Tax=Sutcliffiella tianshenii TaxID=1463404 RepID=A0ABS2NV18_9BACI|nr:hypothetical protein [Bacillus tianshenii]